MSSSRRVPLFIVLFSSGHHWLFFVVSPWAYVIVASFLCLCVIGSSFRRLRYILDSSKSTSQKQDGNRKVQGSKKEMSEFSLQLSPSCNLKNHVSSAVSEVICLLENFSLHGNDEDQLDFTLYKLGQIVYLCVNGQNIWSDFLSDEIIQLLLTAYNSLSKENDDTYSSQSSSSCQRMYTGSVGRPALDIPRETLKLYLSYGFSLEKICQYVSRFKKTNK